jgi:Protein of unknown function (DUF3352)
LPHDLLDLVSSPARPITVVPSLSPERAPGRSRLRRWRGWLLAGLIAAVLVALIAFAAASGRGGGSGPATGAASVVPGDALAYVNVSIDSSRSAVKQALALAERFPDYPLASTALLTRLGAIAGGGNPVDFGGDIRPWLGNEAALAFLNTTTSAADSLIVLDVSDQTRARAFLTRSGARSGGTYRGVQLLRYPSGTELAFVRHYLTLGQDASVRAAIDVASGRSPSLRSDPAYVRAVAGEPNDRVLDAYASAAGVQRILTGQGGLLGALGVLLYQPALQGAAVSLSPASNGARVRVHLALDPALTRLSGPRRAPFAPTLATAAPSGSMLLLDVNGLDKVAPTVLKAGAAAGIGGGVGPLLQRLGGALAAEGVNVRSLESIFGAETAVAITPASIGPGGTSHPAALIIVARTKNDAQTSAALATLQAPLAQLFPAPSSGPGQAPEFNDVQVDGVTAHQLSLTPGLQLDYAVFDGLVVVSTSRDGIAAVISHQRSIAGEPQFRSTLAGRPQRVSSLLFLDFSQLLSLGEQIGLTHSARVSALAPDLDRIRAVGMNSTSGEADTTAELFLQIP